MTVGTLREIKNEEHRVGLTPDCARAYTERGHRVLVERGAGASIGYTDAEYRAAGASIAREAERVWSRADMIVKVKEPLPEEHKHLREEQILFTYLHLAAAADLTRALLDKRVKAVAYETIEDARGGLPCLKPMSEIAGRLSIQEGAKYLEKTFGGRGILLGGVPGVRRGRVAILGGGVVGLNACKMAVGLSADVQVLDLDAERMAYLDDVFDSQVGTLHSTPANIEQAVSEADIVVGAVLVPGARAPKLVRRRHLRLMKPGAVLVDVAIDQGGCFETSRPTRHADPIFHVGGIVHYCVANMPGCVALTATQALTSVTLPYGLFLADRGVEAFCREREGWARGLNVYGGKVVHEGVAKAHRLPHTDWRGAVEAPGDK